MVTAKPAANDSHLCQRMLSAYRVTVRTLSGFETFSAIGKDSCTIHLAAIEQFGVCGVTVTPVSEA